MRYLQSNLVVPTYILRKISSVILGNLKYLYLPDLAFVPWAHALNRLSVVNTKKIILIEKVRLINSSQFANLISQ